MNGKELDQELNQEADLPAKFYYDNFPDLPKAKKLKRRSKGNLQLLSYNIHGWKNLHEDVRIVDNIELMLKMISKYDFDILVFQEVGTFRKFLLRDIKAEFKEEGYSHAYGVANGGDKNEKSTSSYLMVISKKKIKNPQSLDLTNHHSSRNCIYVEIDKLKIVAVHLEIGDRYHHLPEGDPRRQKIIFNNTLRRKWQLQRILNNFEEIDVIIGDFNFTKHDPEYEFLVEKGFVSEGIGGNTTPYNKVDFAFINEKSKFKFEEGTNRSIKCNYSDHLPILCEVTRE